MRVTSFTTIIFALTMSLLSFQNCSHLKNKTNRLDLASQSDSQSDSQSSHQNIFRSKLMNDCTEKTPKKIYYEAYWMSQKDDSIILTKVPSMDEQLEPKKHFGLKTITLSKQTDDDFTLAIPLTKPYCEVTGHLGNLKLEGSDFAFKIENNQMYMQQTFSIRSPEFTKDWGEGVFVVINYYTPYYEGSDNSAFQNNPWFQKNKNITQLLNTNTQALAF